MIMYFKDNFVESPQKSFSYLYWIGFKQRFYACLINQKQLLHMQLWNSPLDIYGFTGDSQ